MTSIDALFLTKAGYTGTAPAIGDMIVAGDTAGLLIKKKVFTASQVLESDSNGQPISAAKGTWYNKNFGTASDTVLEGSNDALYGKLAGTQTFTGNKTFNGTSAFVGAATAVTQTVADNSTKIATTAYVDASVLQWGLALGTGDATLNKTYWNYSIPFIAGSAALWTWTNITTTVSTVNFNNITALTASNTDVAYTAVIYSAATFAQLAWWVKSLRVEFMVKCNSVGTDNMAWGLWNSLNIDFNETGGTNICYTVDKTTSKLYAHTSDSAAMTNTEITGITLTNTNTYRIEYDTVWPTARFYVNGVLKATHTTNVPTSGNILIWGGGKYHGSGNMTDYPKYISIPYVAVAK